MTLEEKIDYLKRQVKFHLTMEDSCVDSHNLYPDLEVAENGVKHKEIAEMLQEELVWLEELKKRRTLMSSLEDDIRRNTVYDFAAKMQEELSAKSERLQFSGNTVDMLTLDNALDAVDVVSMCMVEDK